jgi:hypothetical protein
MPPPANFSNFGRSGGTAALTSRSENFASTPAPTPPPLKVTPPSLRPPAPNTDFSNQNKNIPSDCPVEVKTDSATGEQYCPVDQGYDGDEQGYDRDQYDNPYDYDPSSDYNGSATQAEANAAAELAKQELNDVIEKSKDIGKYLSMAEAGFSLANLGNALLNGIPLANQANSLNADANALKAGAFNLQANVNSSISTLNQGIANRNMGQIQEGFNGLQAAQTQAAQLQAQGQTIQQRANDLQGKAATYQRNTDMLQGASQALGYGAQGANLFGQGYQAATQPNTENYTNFGASLAQTALKAAGDFTSFVSPLGAQVASGAIGAGQQMGVQAGRGASPTDIGLAATNFFGGSVYQNVQKADYYAGQGNDARAAEYATYAALDVAQMGLAASGVAAPVAMVGIPVARGFTAFGSSLAQGADFETSAVYGADVGFASSPVGKILNASNLITGAKQGENLYFNAQQPVTGAIRTIEAPLTSTTLTRDSSGRLGYRYQPSLAAEFRAQGALVQQIQPQGTTFDQASLNLAAARQAAIRGQISGGLTPANFAKE